MPTTKAMAAIEWNSVQARLTIILAVSGGPAQTINVDGYERTSTFDQIDPNNTLNNFNEAILLPNISIDGVLHAIGNPKAKHASFNRKGNAFSRIAYLVQVGYQFNLSGAVEPQPSGVRFKWTGKDLHRYCLKWIKNAYRTPSGLVGSGGDTGRELILHQNDDFTTWYVFTDDTHIKVISAAEGRKLRSPAKAAERHEAFMQAEINAGRTINF